jgi:hypothetical protein
MTVPHESPRPPFPLRVADWLRRRREARESCPLCEAPAGDHHENGDCPTCEHCWQPVYQHVNGRCPANARRPPWTA